MTGTEADSEGDQRGSILRQFGIAVVLAVGFFVCFVLPAEYDFDPLGVGALLGINGMSKSESVMIVPNPVFGDFPASESSFHRPADRPLKFATIDIVLEPFGQAEYKFAMEAGDVLAYTWSTDAGAAYADLHGHTMVDDGELLVEYIKTDSVSVDSGTITAAFAGEHGWYFLNLEKIKQTITLEVGGNFSAQQLIELEPQLP